eukprot:74729-Karenia_brevis.AAC.1
MSRDVELVTFEISSTRQGQATGLAELKELIRNCGRRGQNDVGSNDYDGAPPVGAPRARGRNVGSTN